MWMAWPRGGGESVKKITVRKAGPVRLTSAAQPLYAEGCGGGPIILEP